VYKFQAETELMKNQRAAQMVGELSQLDAVQSSDGLGLLCSIGDDGILYLCAEREQASTGWVPVDITTELRGALSEQHLTAKAFAVSQDSLTGAITVAQVVRAAATGQDHLFVLTDLSDAPGAAWSTSATERNWTARPWDAGSGALADNIAYVALPEARGSASGEQVCVVGVAAGATSLIANYSVSLDPAVTQGIWQACETAEDYTHLDAMQMGKSAAWLGLYELYTLTGEVSLTFTPIASPWGRGSYPVTKLTPPPGASALAVLPVDGEGRTSLYVAGAGGVFLFEPAQQTKDGVPTKVIASALVEGVDFLEVHSDGSEVTLWARNAKGQLVCARCAAGAQADPASWSAPVPVLLGATQVAAVLNRVSGASELYVHTHGQCLTKLTQDSVTTQWRAQSLMLPSLAIDDVIELYTFTTHVSVVDEGSLALPGTTFALSATSPCAVYIEDAYVRLSNAGRSEAVSSPSGTVTIVQETQTLAAVSYTLVQGDGTTFEVHPMAGVLDKLAAVKQGSDLDVQVIDELGHATPLLPATVTDSQKAAVAQAVVQLVASARTLPLTGAPSSALPGGGVGALGGPPASGPAVGAQASWGMSFAGGDVRYVQPSGGFEGAVLALPGDIFHWVEQDIDAVATS
jgi:hypothetical protein